MTDAIPAAVGSTTGADRPLPAQRRDADGRAGIDYRAITALALPLMVNSSLQAVINLTDTWFVGHISTTAMAGMAAISSASETSCPPGVFGTPAVPTTMSNTRPLTAFTASSTEDFEPLNCTRTDTGSSGPTDCVSADCGTK